MPPTPIDMDRLDPRLGSGFVVRAPSMERLFIHTALALHQHLVTVPEEDGEFRKDIVVEAAQLDELMLHWVQAIYHVFEEEGFVCGKVIFRKFDGQKIEATLHGEKFASLKHGVSTGVDAITFHGIERGEDMESGFSTRLFLDYSRVNKAS